MNESSLIYDSREERYTRYRDIAESTTMLFKARTFFLAAIRSLRAAAAFIFITCCYCLIKIKTKRPDCMKYSDTLANIAKISKCYNKKQN